MTGCLHKMKVFGAAVSLSAGLVAYSSMSLAEFDRGEALYENHCKECHESWAHTRDGRHANTLGALRQRVAAWSLHSNLEWSDDEINDVADYLNRKFYQLTD
jgi:mono/diheme cytochrome c family protein